MGSKIDVNKINELLQPKIVEKQFDPTKSLFATEVEEGKDLNEAIFLPYQMQQQFQTYRESYNMNFQSMAGRADLINKYRTISLYPEVMSAIEEIVNTSIVLQDGKPFDIVAKTPHRGINNLLIDRFPEFFISQDINKSIYETFEQWFVDGVLYIWKRDLEDGSYDYYIVDPMTIRLNDRNGMKSWIISIPENIYQVPVSLMFQPGMMYNAYGNEKTFEVPYEQIRVYNSGKYHSRQPIGYLHKALKSANQLNMLKDALIIYRISRAPERLVFRIEVGRLNKRDADAYMKRMIDKYRADKIYNTNTGDFDTKTSVLSMLHNYYFTTQDGKGSDVSTIGGGIDLGNVDDFRIFLTELQRSLSIPRSRMNTDESGSLPLPNNISEISIEEKRFFKYITRLRNQFQHVYLDMYRDWLVKEGWCTFEEFETYRNYITLKFYNDIEIEDAIMYSDLQRKMEIIGLLKDYTGAEKLVLYSVEWIQKNILTRSDSMIAEIFEQIIKDTKCKIFNPEYAEKDAKDTYYINKEFVEKLQKEVTTQADTEFGEFKFADYVKDGDSYSQGFKSKKPIKKSNLIPPTEEE